MNSPDRELENSALRLKEMRSRLDRLEERRSDRVEERRKALHRLAEIQTYLNIADDVNRALDILSGEIFSHMVKVIESSLTLALQEVLSQDIRLRVEQNWTQRGVGINFSVVRGGQSEDILRGQGGSVANILSVGLRFFAINTLDPSEHRRFLVLDEQDCWLRPDLVPRLVHIVYEACRALGFQAIYISHHDVNAFRRYAGKIYEFIPGPQGLTVQESRSEAPGEGKA